MTSYDINLAAKPNFALGSDSAPDSKPGHHSLGGPGRCRNASQNCGLWYCNKNTLSTRTRVKCVRLGRIRGRALGSPLTANASASGSSRCHNAIQNCRSWQRNKGNPLCILSKYVRTSGSARCHARWRCAEGGYVRTCAPTTRLLRRCLTLGRLPKWADSST